MSSITSEVNRHRNISDASYRAFKDLRGKGQPLSVRKKGILELRNRLTVLERPRERCLFLPGRLNDPFAALAETVWVLAGKNDVAWLKPYLPRAADFSDDGKVWRAAYGPRLRHWPTGVDQLRRTRDLIMDERSTRRAVMNLFDPALDYVDSKDIPCSNWLHWLVRDGKLHFNLGMRSNDAMWGFSGVDSFEWSVLHDLMALWCGVEAGEALYVASSFHLYDYHFERADAIVREYAGLTCYDVGLHPPAFSIRFEDFDRMLGEWLRLEEEFRRNPASPCRIDDFIPDPFFANALGVLRIHLGHKLAQWSDRRIADALAALAPTDLSAAAAEYFSRRREAMLADLPQPLFQFLSAYRSGRGPKSRQGLANSIKRLHTQKNAAYGTAWKKRGELISILANIARKVDRLEEFQRSQTTLDSESLEDTAVDLFVYLTKYRLYLLERSVAPSRVWRARTPGTVLSEDLSCFDELVDEAVVAPPPPDQKGIVDQIISGFEALHQLALQEPSVAVASKLALVEHLAGLALAYRTALDVAAPAPRTQPAS